MVKKKGNSSPTHKLHVKIIFLDGSSTRIDIDPELPLQDVFERACHIMNITDTNLFGLAVYTDNQPKFLDLNSKIVKQTTKSWKVLNQEKENDEPVLTVHLQVQCYVEKLSSIRDTNARNYYYLQLKRNFIDYPIMYPDDRCFLLAAYSMIAEDCNDDSNLDPRAFFPAWVVDKHKSKYIKEHLPSLRHKFSSLTKYDAQNLVATALCHETPIGYNMHLYQMAKELNTKQQQVAGRNCSSKHCVLRSTGQCLQCTTFYMGVGPGGVETFEVGYGGFIQRLTLFEWRNVEKIDFTKRKVELVCQGVTSHYSCTSEDLAIHIAKLCQQCHARHLSTEKNQLRRSMNKSFRDKYRESYIHSEQLEDEWNQERGEGSLSASSEFPNQAITGYQFKKDRQNRYSIISDAASSSTSGIVSDRTCFSYYDSQEELLNRSKTITSSQDSLLEPSESSKPRPVQRAISEPSKKFEQLRELKVRQQQPPAMSRAASDDTVRSSQKVADHIYENIFEVRNRLMVAAQAKPSKLSPRVLLDPTFSFNKPRMSNSQYQLQVKSQGALNYSMDQINRLSSSHTPTAFRSQYNIVKPSTSMEQLLKDYQPPPSYNEKHKKVGERMLAAISQEKIAQSLESVLVSSPRAISTEAVYQKRPSIPKSSECTCKTTSYPEMNKLKDMSELPMISALVKDLQTSSPCHHCNNNNSLHSGIDRPFSWHSESFMSPNYLPSISTSTQDSY